MAIWLIHYLSSAYYVADTILGARDSAMNKRDTSVSRGDNILVGETDNTKIKKWLLTVKIAKRTK